MKDNWPEIPTPPATVKAPFAIYVEAVELVTLTKPDVTPVADKFPLNVPVVRTFVDGL